MSDPRIKRYTVMQVRAMKTSDLVCMLGCPATLPSHVAPALEDATVDEWPDTHEVVDACAELSRLMMDELDARIPARAPRIGGDA